MLQVSYSIKCWLLSFSFYMMFYFIVFAKGYASIELLYLLGVSTLLFPISKRIIDALCDTLIPNIVNALQKSYVLDEYHKTI